MVMAFCSWMDGQPTNGDSGPRCWCIGVKLRETRVATSGLNRTPEISIYLQQEEDTGRQG